MELRVGTWLLKITPVRCVLAATAAAGVLLMIFRFAMGLGFSTNLSDNWPWGLWIILDISAIALAGAGYSMAVLAHILHVKDFGPLARRGLLISLLLYVFVLLTLIIEIGRPDNFYTPMYSWGYTSPLWEVLVAITLYMVIQVLEFGEVVTEKACKPLNNLIKKFLPVIFVLGALIPFGHQASLGALFLVMPSKLNELWWSINIPWFFLISSFFAGPAIIALDVLCSSRTYKCNVNMKALAKLARVGGGLMVVYFVWKMFDLFSNGFLMNMFAGTWQSNFFLIEICLGVLLPAAICLSPLINSKKGMLSFALLTVFGVIMNRFNVVYTGLYDSVPVGYTASLVEWGSSIGLLALVTLGYLILVENFNIYYYGGKKDDDGAAYSPEREASAFTVKAN
ncbi:MAG: polysulfide reductase NrfD [Deltaproteobacteria bacterium]|nr:polysulfide reductase NrfD [Deltaproteobacteria bacterium]